MKTIMDTAIDIINRNTTKQVMQLANKLEISSRDTIALVGAPIYGQVFDVATTMIALNRGGFTEANPVAAKFMVGSMLPFAAVKLGLGALMAYSVHEQLEKGNTRTAKILSGIGFLAGAGPAINNVVQLTRKV